MPINSQIPLEARGPQLEPLSQQVGQVQSLQNLARQGDLQRQQMQLNAQQIAEKGLQVASAQRDQADLATLNGAIMAHTNPATGKTDHQGVVTTLAQQNAGHLINGYMQHADANEKVFQQMRTTEDTYRQQRLDYAAGVADRFLGLPAAERSQAIKTYLVQGSATGSDGKPYLDPETVKRLLPLTTLDPATLEQQLQVVAALGSESYVKSKAGLALTAADTAAKTATAAKDSADAQKAAAEAEQIRRGGKPSAEQDDARYRAIQQAITLKRAVSPEDKAWADAYQKQKTLGPAASSAAADVRLGKQEDFTEKQAGRAELTTKIEQPYLESREKADLVRALVTGAKHGNLVAASVQQLGALLGLTSAEGVKRINSVELGEVQQAGTIMDRLRGAFGRMRAGQPLDPKLQQDMLGLADMLDQSAYKKYQEGHTRVTTRYGLTDEKPLPAPGGPAAAGKVSVTAPSGKTYSFPDQATADRAVADAKAKGLWK